MRVLVTGADGFVGRHLCASLKARGDEPIPVEGPSPHHDRGVDLRDAGAIARVVADARPEGLVHLAARASVAESHHDPAATFEVNVLGTIRVLDAVREHAPACRVLLIASGEVYGALPLGSRATETTPLAPLSPYAASKVAAEAVGFQYARAYGLAVFSARSFNHIGAGQAATFVVPSFARQILEARGKTPRGSIAVGNLEPVRDFLHVDDVVDAYRALLARATPAEAYNVCSGAGLRIRDVLDKLIALAQADVEVTPDPARFRPADIPELVGDPGKLAALGWKPRKTLDEALLEVLADARSHIEAAAGKGRA